MIKKVYQISEEELEKASLYYYSDYISFVGQDEQGTVAFAIDTNRGQDGETWQAEHFLAMHDEQQGWLELEGNGFYDLHTTDMVPIPDSEYFQFEGTSDRGMLISSEINQLELTIEPIPVILSNQKGLAKFWMGSAQSTLKWKGRVITGRVIYEFLYLPAFNRLTRKYRGLWKDFHAIYTMIGSSGDLYLHTQLSPFLSPLVGEKVRFVLLNTSGDKTEQLKIEVTKKEQALGFYRWPLAWKGQFLWKDKSYAFDFKLENRRTMWNWVIGGFSMGILKGQLKQGNEEYPLVGIGELLI